MICTKCGYENKGGDKICFKCYAALDYHDIKAEDIDTGGLSLAKDESVAEVVAVKKPIFGRGTVIVILGLLVVIAAAAFFVPQQLAQARAASILEVITAARSGVEAYVIENRVWPADEDNLQPGLSAYLTADMDIMIKKGVISLSIAEEPGKTAIISPSIENGRVVWQCQNGGIGQEFLPLGCFK